MLCQTCSAYNDDEREFCFRCQNKLLVLSGVNAFEEDELEEYDEEGDVSLDEHLLERVSGLEEIVKRSAETLRSVVDAVQKHERAIFINQTGLLSVKELLEKKNVVSSDELVELWESKMGEQMLALEKKQRFTERKDRIISLFRGEKRERFLQYVADAEAAFDAFDPDRGMKALEESVPPRPRQLRALVLPRRDVLQRRQPRSRQALPRAHARSAARSLRRRRLLRRAAA